MSSKFPEIQPMLTTGLAGSTEVSISQKPGRNRATEHCMLSATNDYEAVAAWLLRYSDSKDTQRAYTREVERLIWWAQRERNCQLSDILYEDALAYLAFFRDPTPVEEWVSNRSHKRSHPDWKPFTGKPGPNSVRQAITILKNLFTFLSASGYLRSNPFALVITPKGSATNNSRERTNVQRFLTDRLGGVVFEAINALPKDKKREKARLERYLFMATILRYTGLRRAEIASATNDQLFFNDHSGWWLHVVGKGSKSREVPLIPEVIDSIRRYRVSLGHDELPKSGDKGPLLMGLNGAPKPLHREYVGTLAKEIFILAADFAEISLNDPDISRQLRSASTHWLRHTYATDSLESGVSLKAVQENLGHASLTTTSLYSHIENDKRHLESMKLSNKNSDK